MKPQVAGDDEGRFRLLVESVTDYAIYMLSPGGIVVSWNTGAERIKGYSASEIVGQSFTLFYPEDDRIAGAPDRALATAAREGRFESEGWRVRKDGSRFWAHVVIDRIQDNDGALLGFAKITRDLTERRNAEVALRKSEEQFRLLVQGVTDYAIYMLNPDGVVTSWNSGAQRIKGYRPEEIIGQHFSRFYTDEDRERGEPQRALAAARETGRFENEATRIRKDGSEFSAHVVIDRVNDTNGNLIGFAKITRDITERKAAEANLEETKSALVQAQKIEAIGQLAGGVAHDFNNLLMAVIVSLELLQKRMPVDGLHRKLIENALTAARRGTSLTQRMLAFGRRQPLDTQPVDFVELVRGMADLLRRSIGPSIDIQTHFPLKLPFVIADSNQLELALLNLCVNARDAMPNGGSIVIAASQEHVSGMHRTMLPAGRYVRIQISDSGEGMNKETLLRATEPFFTTKGVGKGTGLGLSMVHGMSEQVGGRLMLTSKDGKGTTAEIWLKATEKAPEAPTKQISVESPVLKVLAVDDDGLVLFNTVAMLEELGHEVFQATSAAAALRLLEDEEMDVVVSDQSMPKMTGLEMRRVIESRWPSLPVIIASGYAELPATDALLLTKPFTERQLAEALTRAQPH